MQVSVWHFGFLFNVFSTGSGWRKNMERTPWGIQKKPETFWVNIKNKGAWRPNLACGGGPACRPCLLWPTATILRKPNAATWCLPCHQVPWCAGGHLALEDRKGGWRRWWIQTPSQDFAEPCLRRLHSAHSCLPKTWCTVWRLPFFPHFHIPVCMCTYVCMCQCVCECGQSWNSHKIHPAGIGIATSPLAQDSKEKTLKLTFEMLLSQKQPMPVNTQWELQTKLLRAAASPEPGAVRQDSRRPDSLPRRVPGASRLGQPVLWALPRP